MKSDKPVVVFVVGNILGGVAYFNKNIINSTSFSNGVSIRVILVTHLESKYDTFTERFEADEVLELRYSSKDNKYDILKRIHKMIGSESGSVVCNDALEMEAIYEFGTPKTVYQIIHDYYNLTLSVKFGRITDVFVAHTRLFRDVIYSSDPGNVKVFYRPHGVSIPKNLEIASYDGKLKIVFAGRLVEGKGVLLLKEIDTHLGNMGISVEWVIIGKGPLKEGLLSQWKGSENVRFETPAFNEGVLDIMKNGHIFLLPTHFEGSPVTVLEALSCGLVPIVSDLPGGITEIVTDKIGKRIPIGDAVAFAHAVGEYDKDRKSLFSARISARREAIDKFDIRKTSDEYFSLILDFGRYKREASPLPLLKFGSHLDHKNIPNFLVRFIRSLKSYF